MCTANAIDKPCMAIAGECCGGAGNRDGGSQRYGSGAEGGNKPSSSVLHVK